MNKLDFITPPSFEVHGTQDGIFRTIAVAPDEGTLSLMRQAATMVKGVTLELMPSETPEQKAAAARAFGQVAIDLNRIPKGSSATSQLSPEGWTEKARRVLDNGGAVVKLTVDQKAVSKYSGLGPFYAKLRELQTAEAPSIN